MHLAKNSLFVVFLQQRLRINTSTIGQHFFDLQHPQGTALKEKKQPLPTITYFKLTSWLLRPLIQENSRGSKAPHEVRQKQSPSQTLHTPNGWNLKILPRRKINRETSTQTTNFWGFKMWNLTQGYWLVGFFAMKVFPVPMGNAPKWPWVSIGDLVTPGMRMRNCLTALAV